MLNLLDELLRTLLMRDVQGLRDTAVAPHTPPRSPVRREQVGFSPPDDQWAREVKNIQLNALNVYLVDLRENRKLRSNERLRGFENSIAYEYPAPDRMDCHYLISAWSPTEHISPQVEPILDEHALLYEAAAALIHSAPLNPLRVYPAGSAPLTRWPEAFRDTDLPVSVAPPEGFPKIAEFWGAMGTGRRWKPVLYLVVTVPVALLRIVAGPMVTTRITEYRQNEWLETAEVWVQIGGHVLNATVSPPAPLADAWVQLETTANEPLQTTRTNELGRFTFGDLRPGRYQLRVRMVGFGELTPPRTIEIPSPTGEYDLRFS